MASFQTNTNNTYYAILEVVETGQSTTERYMDLAYSVTLYNGVQNFKLYTIGYDLYINGVQVAYQNNSGNQTSMEANSSKLVCTGTTRVYYDSDGTKNNMPVSLRIFTNNLSYLPVELNTSGTMNLTPLPVQEPEYANFTEHYISNTGLNSITVNWNADAACDAVFYSLNGGEWIGTSNLSYQITGLEPNTTYSVRTRIKRQDSQLWTESILIYGTTLDIARVGSVPNINLGDNARISITNPSGSSIKYFVEIVTPYSSLLERTAITGDNIIVFSDEELDKIYKNMGTANSITLRFGVVTNNSYWHWLDSVCFLTGNQKTVHTNVNGAYKRAKRWVNVNGTWKRAVRWVNVNGTWKRTI